MHSRTRPPRSHCTSAWANYNHKPRHSTYFKHLFLFIAQLAFRYLLAKFVGEFQRVYEIMQTCACAHSQTIRALSVRLKAQQKASTAHEVAANHKGPRSALRHAGHCSWPNTAKGRSTDECVRCCDWKFKICNISASRIATMQGGDCTTKNHFHYADPAMLQGRCVLIALNAYNSATTFALERRRVKRKFRRKI